MKSRKFHFPIPLLLLLALSPTKPQLLDPITLVSLTLDYFKTDFFQNKILDHCSKIIANEAAKTSPSASTAHQQKCVSTALAAYNGGVGPKFVDSAQAMGFQYDKGAVWGVICHGTTHGSVPGKMLSDGTATYPWGGKEHDCVSPKPFTGRLVFYTSAVPCDCLPNGYQKNDDSYYHNVVVETQYGMIPGKGKADFTAAWYGMGGKEIAVSSNFYIVC